MLAALGALATLVGCFLPWWTRKAPEGLPALSGTAFEGMGIVVFIAALVTIALVTLPYARERPVRFDAWRSYAIIAAVAWLAFLYRLADLAFAHAIAFDQPTDVILRIPGLWVTAIGLIVLGRAAYDMWQAPSER